MAATITIGDRHHPDKPVYDLPPGRAVAAHQRELIQIRCPKQLTAAIKRASAAQGQTASQYVRSAVVERLHHDGAQAA